MTPKRNALADLLAGMVAIVALALVAYAFGGLFWKLLR